jgi:pyruvate,water dikinase
MLVLVFSDCNHTNKHLVGGKNSSLGELKRLSQRLNFNIADGFAVTTCFYDAFLQQNGIAERIESAVQSIRMDDIDDVEQKSGAIRALITAGVFTDEQVALVQKHYQDLCTYYKVDQLDVAVRSSAIAEDLPNASFAGQQDTYLNVTGIDQIMASIRKCFASLFNSRAVSYRHTHAIDYSQVKISVGIQKMVRSDKASAGVAFSIDPETGYSNAVVINSAFGLGELVVSGAVKPDEFIVDKRVAEDIYSDPIIMKKLGDKHSKIVYDADGAAGGTQEVPSSSFEALNYSIDNNDAVTLARYVLFLEKAYSDLYNKRVGVDVEWAIDGYDKRIYIIQTRPETIHSNSSTLELTKYILKAPAGAPRPPPLIKGVAVGSKISTGRVKVLTSIQEHKSFQKGDILVTDMTTPDWEPIMKISAGIITNKGGRTCHAAIVARELGINALVGTGNCTSVLASDREVTVVCSEGEEGYVYDGALEYSIETCAVDAAITRTLPVQLMLNIGNPENSFASSLIPNSGVGLARLEFIISNYIRIHPLALRDYPTNVSPELREQIYNIIGNHTDGRWYFVKRLARGIAKIASAFYPNDVIVRLSDFKSNEYRNLIGGNEYEPREENPMIGWRGASRYYSDEYIRGFELECAAIDYVRTVMKMRNVVVMIPFCRTPEECNMVLQTMRRFGLERHKDGLKVFLMCEIPSNVIEADRFAPYVDGVSIGGNDLLQLTLGIDRDSEKITYLGDHTNVSYRRMISMAIRTYKEHGVKVGFCGQQPSDSTEFCEFLIREGIDSISVTPDSAIRTIQSLTQRAATNDN